MKAPMHEGTEARRFRAFTLTELLIAIAVLIIVILAASRIFATASQVTGIGQATADVMTEAATIERMIREDVKRMSHEGVLVIRNSAVRNDINGAALLNPDLPADAELRCDQLVFFATGVEGSQAARLSDGRNTKGQSTESFVYYGHTYQMPDAPPFQSNSFLQGYAFDADPGETVYPWTSGPVDIVRTNFESGADTNGTSVYSRNSAGQTVIIQPGARRWLLARQTAILIDDDTAAPNENGKAVYRGQVTCARSVFFNNPSFTTPAPGWASFLSPQLRDGRVDAACSTMDDIRRVILSRGDWDDQRQYILDNLVRYPRAERTAPSVYRVDQALTNHVISSSCSSFTVEWTYDLGVGEAAGLAGVSNGGVVGSSLAAYDKGTEVRWFGMRDPEHGVYPYGSDQWPDHWTGQAGHHVLATGAPSNTYTIYPNNIEQFVEPSAGHSVVNYVFGFNQDKPFLNPITGLPDASTGVLPGSQSEFVQQAYTPWPSALRITMRLHDPDAKLEGGRKVQFIVRLPEPE